MTEPTLRASARRPWLAGFAALNAFGAWAGAVGLVTGGMDFGESINDRLPFDSLVLAGLALGIIVGIPLTVLAWSAWTGGSRTDDVALAVGLMLIVWIVVQVAVIRAFSLFQPVYLAVGASFVAASHRVTLSPHRRGVLFVAVGSILAAVGFGLLPHPIKNGLTTMSVVAITLLLSGIALVGFGAVSAFRGRRRVGALAGSAVVLFVLAAAVSIIAPAVAATNVPTTEITSTPATVGLEYESVTFTTTDGVELAAWYMPGTNRAGVVVMHGAGSTRSDVLDQAAVLARSGYTMVLVDARGHGDSGGTAMDFGWYGDLDIAAGLSSWHPVPRSIPAGSASSGSRWAARRPSALRQSIPGSASWWPKERPHARRPTRPGSPTSTAGVAGYRSRSRRSSTASPTTSPKRHRPPPCDRRW
jgi:hypothetical protein